MAGETPFVEEDRGASIVAFWWKNDTDTRSDRLASRPAEY
jgi:hypothetical protein